MHLIFYQCPTINFVEYYQKVPEYYTERKLLLFVKSNNVIVIPEIWS